LQHIYYFHPSNPQEDISQEAETGKIYRADYKDKLGRTVLVLRPGLEVSRLWWKETDIMLISSEFRIELLKK
jgi:hypothetical protein